MSSASTSGYTAALTRQFSGRIDELELDDLGKHFLRDRWLDQLLWFEANAGNNKRRSHGRGDPAARVGDVPRQPRRRAQRLARGLLPLRRAVALVPPHPEMLKAQGWMFIELAGPYAGFDRTRAFTAFAAQVEALVQQDLEAFVAQAAAALAAQRGQHGEGARSPS